MLELGALGDLPAHADEDVGHAVLQGGERVAGTGAAAARGGGDVDGLLDEDACGVLFLEDRGACGERLVHASAGGAHELAGDGLLALVQAADLAVGQRERGLLPGVGQACGLQLVQVGRCGKGGQCRLHRNIDASLVGGMRDDR